MRSLYQPAKPQMDAVEPKCRTYHERFRELLLNAIEAKKIRDDTHLTSSSTTSGRPTTPPCHTNQTAA